MLTESLEIKHYDPMHQKVWEIKGEKAAISYEGKNEVLGTLYNAQGKLYQHSLVVSTFSANQVIADQKKNQLKLNGNVLVTSIQEKTELRADSLIYLAKQNRIKAKGNVRISGPTYLFGPTPEIWSDAKLTEIGTPETF